MANFFLNTADADLIEKSMREFWSQGREFINNKREENMSEQTIHPLHDRVVIKRVEKTLTTPGGIVLTENAADKPSEGIVIEVGTGKQLPNGKVRKPTVKAGDRVVFSKYIGNEVKHEGETYIIMKEDDILSIVEDC